MTTGSSPGEFPAFSNGRRSPCILEREAELAVIEEGLELACRGRGRMVLVEGPAGIGKTRLLSAAVGGAGRLSMPVLFARAGQLEHDFAFGVVRQLFEPVVLGGDGQERRALIGGAAALAMPLFDSECRPDAPSADPLQRTLYGLFWLTANLARSSPTLLVVDDIHWADESSLRFLAYLARRLEGLAVLVLASARPGEPVAASSSLDELLSDPFAVTLQPSPLSPAAVHELVRDALPTAVDPEFTATLQDCTGGNPLFVNELILAARRHHIPTTRDGSLHLRKLVPDTVSRFVQRRLEGLGAEASALAAALAILGDGADLLAAADLAGLGCHEAERGVRSLRRVHVLQPGEPLDFVHPVVRSAVYEGMDPKERDAKHRQAARVHDRVSGMAIYRAAAHLVATRPAGDAAIVARLREAARQAMAAGAPDVSVTYLARALSEPPGAGELPAVLLELGTAEARVRPDQALEHLDEALKLSQDDAALGDAAVELAVVLSGSGRIVEAVDTLEKVAARVSAPSVSRRLEAELIWLAGYDAQTHRRGQAHLASHWGDAAADRVGRQLLGLQASARARAGVEPVEALGNARRALAGGVLLREHHAPAFTVPVTVLVLLDRFDEALGVLADAMRHARRTGDLFLFTLTSMLRADLRWRIGELDEAEADAVNEVAQGEIFGRVLALSRCLADVLIERGRIEEADELLARAEARGENTGTLSWALFRTTRGRLRLLQDRVDDGVEDLLTGGRWLSALGGRNPALAAWRSYAALGLDRLGRHEEAVCLSNEDMALARQWGAPRALGQSLTSAGLLVGGDAGLDLLEEAVTVLDGSPARLVHAHALLAYGASLRRRNRRTQAREPLLTGLELSERCGARVLVEAARQELLETGARPRRPMRTGVDALTPSERRVARLAADGQTNGDIAQALFVTEKTIEMHLSRAYQKLSIRSRTQLATALADDRRGG